MKNKTKGVWFIGNSGSGKSYASKIVSKKVKNNIILDGDQIRKFVSKDLKYKKKDRIIQTNRVLGFSIICINQNLFPIISTSYLGKEIAKIAKKNHIQIIEICRNKSFLFKKIKEKKNIVGVDIFLENFERLKITNDKNFKKNINSFIKNLNF
tara:strand:- start:947 stop:1405 length:459 start_codon:yes stop_codon:yes gene_type:complete